MKINGWLRLWMVVSTIWVILFTTEVLYPAIMEPVSGNGILPYEYAGSLEKSSRSQLCEVLIDNNCWRVEMPSGAVIQFKSTVDEESSEAIVKDIHRLSIEHEKYLHRDRIFGALEFVFVPPLILLAIGLAAAWVWRGFAEGKRP